MDHNKKLLKETLLNIQAEDKALMMQRIYERAKRIDEMHEFIEKIRIKRKRQKEKEKELKTVKNIKGNNKCSMI